MSKRAFQNKRKQAAKDGGVDKSGRKFHGSKTGRALNGEGPETRSGKRSLGSQKDGDIPNTMRESKADKYAAMEDESKVKRASRKSRNKGKTANSSSSKVKGGMMSNVSKSTGRFKNAKKYK